MDALVQRVRGVMNLLLIWALILFWVATIKPVDIHKLCHGLETNWLKLQSAARNGGVVSEPSLTKPQGPLLSTAQSALLNRLSQQTTKLSHIRYSSLLSYEQNIPPATAQTYLLASEQALRTVQQGVDAKHPGLSSADIHALIATLQRHVAELRWHIERLELSPTATLADLASEAWPSITIPGTGQSVPMASGVALSIVGLACVYFYLVSLLRAVRDSLPDQHDRVNTEWVLLHPGWLGPLLGLIWMSLPMAAIFTAMRTVFSHQGVNTVFTLPDYTILLLPVAWAWSLIAALRTRLAAFRSAREQREPAAHNTAELRLAAHTDFAIPRSQHRRAA